MLNFKRSDERDTELAAMMQREDLRAEACRDLAQRSIVGVVAYFTLWLIIYYASELEHANDALLEFLGFMLGASGVGRLYLALNFQKLYAANPRRWRWLFALGTVTSAAIWGTVCALALGWHRVAGRPGAARPRHRRTFAGALATAYGGGLPHTARRNAARRCARGHRRRPRWLLRPVRRSRLCTFFFEARPERA